MLTFVVFGNDLYAIFCVLNDMQVSQLMMCNIVSYKQQYMNSFLIYFIVDVFQNHRTTLKRISQAAHLVPSFLKIYQNAVIAISATECIRPTRVQFKENMKAITISFILSRNILLTAKLNYWKYLVKIKALSSLILINLLRC